MGFREIGARSARNVSIILVGQRVLLLYHGPHSIQLVGSVNFLEFVTPKQNSETVVPLLQANCVVPPFSLGSFWNPMTSIGFWFLKVASPVFPYNFKTYVWEDHGLWRGKSWRNIDPLQNLRPYSWSAEKTGLEDMSWCKDRMFSCFDVGRCGPWYSIILP